MNPAQLLAHFERISEAPDAVPRLRRFILDLAVRGKLVEQDPNDEPASEMLRRMRTEKAGLSPRMPSSSGDLYIPFETPSSWQWVQLADVLTKLTDGTHHSPPNHPVGPFKYITAKNIKPEGVALDDVSYVTADVHREIYARCNPEPGDLLYIKDGATTGVVTVNNLDEPFSMLSSVALLKPSCHVFNRLLVAFLRSPFFYSQMRAQMKGAAITRVTLKRMAPALVPLPPLAEQHRIVGKVDELMALCDRLEAAQTERETRRDRVVAASLNRLSEPAADGNQPFRDRACFHLRHLPRLTTRPEHIQQLRQTILNLAVRGRLVPQDCNDEPATVLASRARQARDGDGPSGRPGRRRPDPDEAGQTPPAEIGPRIALPTGWTWVAWRQVGACQNGRAFPSSDYSREGVRLLRPGNLLADGSVAWTTENTRSLPERFAREYPEFIVGEQEVVMNLTAQSLKDAFLGRACLTGRGERCLLNQRLARLTPFATTPRYTLWLLKSAAFRDYVDGGLNQGALIQHMFTRQVDDFEFPLPPLAEQHRIVAKVEQLMALCDRLQAQLTKVQTEPRRLLEAVLQQALSPVA